MPSRSTRESIAEGDTESDSDDDILAKVRARMHAMYSSYSYPWQARKLMLPHASPLLSPCYLTDTL